jgi:hypothetical protein
MELQGVKLLSLTSLKDVHKQGNRDKLIPFHILFSVEEITLTSTNKATLHESVTPSSHIVALALFCP